MSELGFCSCVRALLHSSTPPLPPSPNATAANHLRKCVYGALPSRPFPIRSLSLGSGFVVADASLILFIHTGASKRPLPPLLTTPIKVMCGESTLFLPPFSSRTWLISFVFVALPAWPPPRPARRSFVCSSVFLGRTTSPFHPYSSLFSVSAAHVWCTGAAAFFFPLELWR